MSRFPEHIGDLARTFTEYVLEPLKAASRSFVEDDEYVLVFVVFCGIPALVVTLLIARYIRRAHNRVRYASEYRDTDGTDYISSSSSASSSTGSDAGESENNVPGAAGLRRRRRRGRRDEVTMDEVVDAARQLTEQEAQQRRRDRREAARCGRGGGVAGAPAPDGETEGKEE